MVKIYLTIRFTNRIGMKVCHSDPISLK